MDGETQVTMFVKIKQTKTGKHDEEKEEHHEADESTPPESNEKENHSSLSPSVDNLYKPSTDEKDKKEEVKDTADEAEVPQVRD